MVTVVAVLAPSEVVGAVGFAAPEASPWPFVALASALVAVAVVVRAVHVIGRDELAVVRRPGRPSRVRTAGLVVAVPFLDSLERYRLDPQLQRPHIGTVTTRDGLRVWLDAELRYRLDRAAGPDTLTGDLPAEMAHAARRAVATHVAGLRVDELDDLLGETDPELLERLDREIDHLDVDAEALRVTEIIVTEPESVVTWAEGRRD